MDFYTKELLIEWADKIDSRLGPISGRDADFLARMLRATAERLQQLVTDRNYQDHAIRDAINQTARTADELAFWKHQAIFWRAYAYDARLMSSAPIPEDKETWRTAERDLEAARVTENRERYAHAEPPRSLPTEGNASVHSLKERKP